MSRIGRKPVVIPNGVTVTIDGSFLTVKGPKGELERNLNREMKISVSESEILVERPSDQRDHRSLHGLTRTLISNMVQGVTEGYQRVLELVGTGYRASKSGKKLVLTVGYSHPVEMDPPAGIEVEVPAPASVIVKGIDKEAVGAFSANVRDIRPPEPYLGKGIRYAGEKVRRKVGKTGKK